MWEQWLRLPLGIRILIIALSVVALIAVVAAIDPRAVWFLLAGLLVIALVLGGFILFRQWQARRASRAFSKGLSRANVSSPNAIVDPSQRARLADLRQVFEKGIREFSSAGKDIYSLPWYLVCGEPGSGKTETIRHSNVGFPPGLQDERQGVGGTINMHWWFTNHAVLLDTAGKMLFHEAQPGTTSEWTEFLTLLKTHRPTCPVNGLLLVIPSDSLLKDNPDEIQRKAGRIVRQLEQIQKILDVRFPVFVLITKCDLIYGFREFFANVGEARLQQQMLGWSNPEPLDVPFRSDLVIAHIEEVAAKLRRRRLLLMRDPVPAAEGGRRLDEVDSFFDLPVSLAAISPRLNQYLEVIFVSGEWTKKPLFLRGIYFTSSLIEGNALDVELASALGIPVDHLPEQKSWDRNRTFFLRDLFLHKIFREKGLVTGASNVQTVKRRRRAILGGAAVAGAALLMFISWIGTSALRRSVFAELNYWQAGARDWNEGRWHPVVAAGPLAGQWAYAGSQPVDVGGQPISLVDYHDALEKLASHDIAVPSIFRPMESLVAGTSDLRRRAQRILFEASVVEPLVSSVRTTLLNPGAGWDDANAERMALLLKIEGMINQRAANGKWIGPAPSLEPGYFFQVTLQPWLGSEPVPEELARVFEATLLQPGDAPWPEPWMSGGRTFNENRPLAKGWDAFTDAVRNVGADQKVGVEQIGNTRAAIELFIEREKEFFHAVGNPEHDRWQAAGLDAAFEALAASRSTVDEMLNRTAALDGMPSSLFTLQGAYHAVFEHARERSSAAAHAIAAACTVPDPPGDEPQIPDLPLVDEIQQRLVKVRRNIEEAYQQAVTPAGMSGIPKLDMEATVPARGTSDRVYAYRFGVYRDILAQMSVRTEDTDMLMGRLGEALAQQQAALGEINERVMKYEGELRPEFVHAAKALLERANADGPVNLVGKYSSQLEQLLVLEAGFPVIRGAGGMEEGQMRTLYADLQKVANDAKLESTPKPAAAAYAAAAARINQVAGFVRSVALPTGRGAPVKISVASLADQRRVLEKLAPREPFAESFAGNQFRTLRLGEKSVRSQAADATEIIAVAASDALPSLEFFYGAETKPNADARAAINGTWGPLRLIYQEHRCMATDGGRTWLCPVEVIGSEPRCYFVLSLQFDQPIPTPDQWP